MLAAIALGSNLPSAFGDPLANIREAVQRLGTLGKIVAVSRPIQTEPVTYRDQPEFTNAAALIQTSLDPLGLLRALLSIEQAMGRVRHQDLPPKGPRIIDLDLLICVDDSGQTLLLQHPELTLPHPEMHQRAFVLQPLAEIAPNLDHPVLHRSVLELWQTLQRT